MTLRAAALAVYIAVAALTTWPLVVHLSLPLGAPGGGDAASLQTLFLRALFVLTHDAALSYNIVLLASLVAAAGAMHAFARLVTGSWWGALIAGLAWGFWPYHFAHLDSLPAQALYFMPLAFLFLHRVMAGRRVADAMGLGLTTAMQALASHEYGLVSIVGLASAAVALAFGIGKWRSLAIARLLLVAALFAAVLAAPGLRLLAYASAREDAGIQSIESKSPDRMLVPGANLLYGTTGVIDSIAGRDHTLFPGVTILALAAVGVARARRRDAQPLALGMCAAIIAGLIVPAGYGILVVFGLSVLAAAGIRDLMAERRGRAGLLPAALAALVCVEYVNVPSRWVSATMPAYEAPGPGTRMLYSDTSHSTRV